MFQKSMIDCIGRTPLVQLRMNSHSGSQVYAKLELMNPFGMKDRVAKETILEAKRSGALREGAPIIESSSGTMALGLALVGTYLGHEVHIVTDPRIDPITLAKLRVTGCVVHIVQKMTGHGWQSARLERLTELMNCYPHAFWPRQYDNPSNPLAYAQLARELLEDLDKVDVLVGSVGSGGSLCGTAHILSKTNPDLRVIGVDAIGSVIFGQPDRPTRLQSGLGNSIVPANVDLSIIDEVHWLNDSEAFAGTWELASAEKIFAGNSSGSVYAVARWISQVTPADKKIVAIFPDRGDRYFNTLYNEEYLNAKGIHTLVLPKEPQEISSATIATSWSFARLKAGKKDAKSITIC